MGISKQPKCLNSNIIRKIINSLSKYRTIHRNPPQKDVYFYDAQNMVITTLFRYYFYYSQAIFDFKYILFLVSNPTEKEAIRNGTSHKIDFAICSARRWPYLFFVSFTRSAAVSEHCLKSCRFTTVSYPVSYTHLRAHET